MALNMKQMVVIAVMSSLVVLSLAGRSACEEGANGMTQTIQNEQNGVPVFVMRPNTKLAGSGMPNIYLGWTKWPAFSSFAPLFKPLEQTLGGPTQQISDLFGQLPGAQPVFQQIDTAGSQVTGMLNPSQLFGSLPGLGRRR